MPNAQPAEFRFEYVMGFIGQSRDPYAGKFRAGLITRSGRTIILRSTYCGYMRNTITRGGGGTNVTLKFNVAPLTGNVYASVINYRVREITLELINVFEMPRGVFRVRRRLSYPLV